MVQGGLKAVVWSDAFQMVVMVAGFLTVLVQGTHKSGGMSVVWETAQAGQRLNVFEYVSPNHVLRMSSTAPISLTFLYDLYFNTTI